jgi:putative DNA primase/helicase
MIDLNDVRRPLPLYDLDAIRERLAATAADWLPALFPNARRSADGQTLRCADLSGRPPRNEGSCVIYLKGPRAGTAYDFATGESAGPIDLLQHATGLTDAALFAEAARLAGLVRSWQASRPTTPRPDPGLEVARILAGCKPLAGTPAETYLGSRGLPDPGCADLLYHPDLADFETTRGWAGMVAVVRDAAGAPTGGIHRTFLLDDGTAKAPPGKKMLGSVAGGAVRLWPMPEDGRLGIAEGIETALAAGTIFGLPVWAALSADGLRRWQWPDGTRHVTIFADAGDAGIQAAATLADRLNLADIPNTIITPLHGDDFNDDLGQRAKAADYLDEPEQQPADAAPTHPATVADFEALARSLTNPPDLAPLGTLLGRLALARLDPLPERQVLAAIKASTGIAVSILARQLGELCRRVDVTGDPNAPIPKPRWLGRLRMDLSGTPERNEANVIIALSSDEVFAGAIAFDEFAQKIVVCRPLPWDTFGTSFPRSWDDNDEVRTAEWLQRRGVNVTPLVAGRAVGAVAGEHRIHPVRDWLNSLRWDGKPRLEAWTSNYLGAEPTALNHMIGALWMISAVARIYRPGVKADHMLILEGPQGTRKSTALKVLAGEPWFTDELPELGSKDAALHLLGVWIVEVAELDAIGRAEVSRIKAFVTRTTDRFRPPYGRHTIEVPRQCVFAGTVNPDTYLRDETGNRRFWPLRCGTIDIAALARDRDQLWAEAVARYREGATWWLDDPTLIQAAGEAQQERFQADAWDAKIDRWLTHERSRVNYGSAGFDDWREVETERTTPLTDVSVGEVLEHALGIEPARWTKADQMRVGAYLKSRNWGRYQCRTAGSREWRYRTPAASPASSR